MASLLLFAVASGGLWAGASLGWSPATFRVFVGTLILSAGGLLNSALGQMDAFSVSLVAGISVMFAGFLLTTPDTRPVGSNERFSRVARVA